MIEKSPLLLLAEDVAAYLRMTDKAFLAARDGMEANGFPKPMRAFKKPLRWSPWAIAAWEFDQLDPATREKLATNDNLAAKVANDFNEDVLTARLKEMRKQIGG